MPVAELQHCTVLLLTVLETVTMAEVTVSYRGNVDLVTGLSTLVTVNRAINSTYSTVGTGCRDRARYLSY